MLARIPAIFGPSLISRRVLMSCHKHGPYLRNWIVDIDDRRGLRGGIPYRPQGSFGLVAARDVGLFNSLGGRRRDWRVAGAAGIAGADRRFGDEGPALTRRNR
jgi:hypothetical protein